MLSDVTGAQHTASAAITIHVIGEWSHREYRLCRRDVCVQNWSRLESSSRHCSASWGSTSRSSVWQFYLLPQHLTIGSVSGPPGDLSASDPAYDL